ANYPGPRPSNAFPCVARETPTANRATTQRGGSMLRNCVWVSECLLAPSCLDEQRTVWRRDPDRLSCYERAHPDAIQDPEAKLQLLGEDIARTTSTAAQCPRPEHIPGSLLPEAVEFLGLERAAEIREQDSAVCAAF